MEQRKYYDKKYICEICGKDKGATLHLYGMGYCKHCKDFTKTKTPCEACDYKREYGMPCYGEPCTIGVPL